MQQRRNSLPRRRGGLLGALGTGVITGAADDDPSAIGTYASAGARFGLGFLWIAPVLLPMMYAVVYLSAKLGQVYRKGLFAAIRDHYPRWVLFPLLAMAILGNIIEAAADLGGIGAGLNILIPIPIPVIVTGVAVAIVVFQYFGSYQLLRSIFQWLALALFAYVIAAILAQPNPMDVLKGTVIPRFEPTGEFLSILVACLGTSLSAYIFTWQSNQEVEERRPLHEARRDVLLGMTFSNLILYFIILTTGATLHEAGQTQIETAAQAAEALAPLAGPAAGILFAIGMVGVGVLAVPVMTTGAAYDLVQGFGEPGSLHARPAETKLFYATIAVVTAVAVALNFLGLNPMRALLWSGIVQGFSVPPLLLLIMLMTNSRRMMGAEKNGRLINILGWSTTGVTFLATGWLVMTWIR